MRITKNGSSQSNNSMIINAADENIQNSASSKRRLRDKETDRKSIFAGNLNIMSQQDALAQKHVKGQKNALKAVLDQFKKDRKIDDNLSSRSEHITELEEENKQAKTELDKVQKLRQDLKDAFQITDDSDEEKELQLLRKSMNPFESLTEDEWDKVRNIKELSEYQKSALQYDEMEEFWQDRYRDSRNGIVGEEQSIIGIKLELLKSHPMTDAQKEAAKIMESVNKELIAAIIQQAKEDYDEKLKKEKEAAEKEAEKLKEKEPKDKDDVLNKEKKENQEIQEDHLEQEKLEAELKNILNKSRLNEDDIKGILVDEVK